MLPSGALWTTLYFVQILFALCAPLFSQIFATDEAEKTEPWIGDWHWWPRFATVMYPIFIDKKSSLCNVLHLKIIYMAIKLKVFKVVFYGNPSASGPYQRQMTPIKRWLKTAYSTFAAVYFWCIIICLLYCMMQSDAKRKTPAKVSLPVLKFVNKGRLHAKAHEQS